MSDLEHRRTQQSETNPNIARTTEELKALEARPSVIPPEANKDKTGRAGHLPWIAGGVVTAIVLTGGYLASRGGEEPSSDQPRETQGGPVNPGEAENNEKTETITEFGLDPATYEKDPEALAHAFNEQVNAFYIAGVDEKIASADKRYEMQDDEYVDYISTEIDQEFVNALFVKDWHENPNLVELVDGTLSIAHSARWGRLVTFGGGTDEKEPYVRGKELDEVTGTTNPLTTTMRWHEFDNRDMNTVESSMTGVDPNTETGGATYTWVVEDGQLKISDSTYYAG